VHKHKQQRLHSIDYRFRTRQAFSGRPLRCWYRFCEATQVEVSDTFDSCTSPGRAPGFLFAAGNQAMVKIEAARWRIGKRRADRLHWLA